MQFAVISLAAALALWPAPQSRPDFSGLWVVENTTQGGAPPTSGAATGRAGQTRNPVALSSRCRITQTTAELVLEIDTGPSPVVARFSLSGADSPNRQGTVTTISRATWQGASLVITTRLDTASTGATGLGGSLTRALSLREDGRLVVEMTTSTGETYQSIYKKNLP